MKKLFFTLFLLISTALASVAQIYPGAYENDRGVTKYIIAQGGKEIYHLDNQGNVDMTYEVVSEQYDSNAQVTILYIRVKGLSNQVRMETWQENGVIYLDNGLQRFHRV